MGRFDACGLVSFHGIENLTELQEANFYGKEGLYTDLDPFRNLTKLETLHLPMRAGGNTEPYRADGLANLSALTELYMDRSVASLEPLRNLTRLRLLDVRNGYTVDGTYDSLEPLAGLTGLQELYLMLDKPANPVDLSPLASGRYAVFSDDLVQLLCAPS